MDGWTVHPVICSWISPSYLTWLERIKTPPPKKPFSNVKEKQFPREFRDFNLINRFLCSFIFKILDCFWKIQFQLLVECKRPPDWSLLICCILILLSRLESGWSPNCRSGFTSHRTWPVRGEFSKHTIQTMKLSGGSIMLWILSWSGLIRRNSDGTERLEQAINTTFCQIPSPK